RIDPPRLEAAAEGSHSNDEASRSLHASFGGRHVRQAEIGGATGIAKLRNATFAPPVHQALPRFRVARICDGAEENQVRGGDLRNVHRAGVSPGIRRPVRRMISPGTAPVARPFSYTSSPLTQTASIPADSKSGDLGVARSMTVSGSNRTRSARIPSRTVPLFRKPM